MTESCMSEILETLAGFGVSAFSPELATYDGKERSFKVRQICWAV